MPLKAASPVTICMVSDLSVLHNYLSNADFDSIQRLAKDQRRTLSFLTALTYDQSSAISWRAIEAIGIAASQIAKEDPEYVRVHLRRLIWLLNDESGGIGWRAPEAVGEILFREPELFKDFIPILVNLIDMEPEDARRFRAGWLWAVSRLAAVRPEEAKSAIQWVTPSLADSDPQVRGMAVWCLSRLAAPIPEKNYEHLRQDNGLVELYVRSNLISMTISELIDNASDNLR